MEDIDSKQRENNSENKHLVKAKHKIVSDIREYDVISDSEVEKCVGIKPKVTVNNNLPQCPGQKNDEGIEASGNMLRNSGTKHKESTQISSRNRLSSADKNCHGLDQTPAPRCPQVNTKEKIIFCVDVSADMEKPIFRSRAGDKMTSKQLVRKGLSIFLQSKQKLDKKHEYALIFLKEDATWVRDFTNVPRDILIVLDDIFEWCECDSCDADSVFNTVARKVEMPSIVGDIEMIPPEFTVRVIMLYGRPNCPLVFKTKESFNLLNTSPYFFLDALYFHEPLSDDNKCQEVFDSICDLDQKGLSYIFGASRNQTKVYDATAQMLAHPLQRPIQHDAAYRIGSISVDAVHQIVSSIPNVDSVR